MKWLVALEIDDDPIATCRVMNIFRRKGLKIVTLAMAAAAPDFSIMAVLETAEPGVEHLFNFLRRTEGVRHVTCYREHPGADTSFVYVDADSEASNAARFLETFPDAKLILGGHGKYLLEAPLQGLARPAALHSGRPELLYFARVWTTRSSLTMNEEGGTAVVSCA